MPRHEIRHRIARSRGSPPSPRSPPAKRREQHPRIIRIAQQLHVIRTAPPPPTASPVGAVRTRFATQRCTTKNTAQEHQHRNRPNRPSQPVARHQGRVLQHNRRPRLPTEPDRLARRPRDPSLRIARTTAPDGLAARSSVRQTSHPGTRRRGSPPTDGTGHPAPRSAAARAGSPADTSLPRNCSGATDARHPLPIPLVAIEPHAPVRGPAAPRTTAGKHVRRPQELRHEPRCAACRTPPSAPPPARSPPAPSPPPGRSSSALPPGHASPGWT